MASRVRDLRVATVTLKGIAALSRIVFVYDSSRTTPVIMGRRDYARERSRVVVSTGR